ncbi:MAG TPA: hypothetical protein VEW07_11395 [Solirubrobacterales bacterium]|nr:hypothetical protein [Solirubrobacterales bacterium]
MSIDIGDRMVLRAKATNRETGEPVKPENAYWKVIPVKGDADDIAVIPATLNEDETEFVNSYWPTIPGDHQILFHGRGDDGGAEETKENVKTPKIPREPAP